MDEWPRLIIERTRDRVVLLVGANGEAYGHQCHEMLPEGDGWPRGLNADLKRSPAGRRQVTQ